MWTCGHGASCKSPGTGTVYRTRHTKSTVKTCLFFSLPVVLKEKNTSSFTVPLCVRTLFAAVVLGECWLTAHGSDSRMRRAWDWVQLSTEVEFAGRKSHAAVTIGDDVWVFGGVSRDGQLSDELQQVRPGPPFQCWQRLAEGPRPPPTVLHSMVAHEAEGEGILFGGLIALHEATTPAQHVGTDSLWVLHTGLPGSSGCAWTSPAHVGTAPCARIGHCAALREQGGGGAIVYVYGGFVPDLVLAPYEDISEPGARPQLVGCKPPNAGAFLNDLVILTLPGWEWSRPNVSVDQCSPPACISATLTSLGRHSPHLMLFGGVAHGKPTQQALLLDAEALTMRELPVPESVRASQAHAAASRCNHSATLVQGQTLVIYGGATGEWEHDGAIMLDTNSLEWGVLEARGAVIPLPRQRHAAVAVREGLLVLGGSCGDRLLGEVHLLRVPAITVPLSALGPPQTPPPPSVTPSLSGLGSDHGEAYTAPVLPFSTPTGPPPPPPSHASMGGTSYKPSPPPPPVPPPTHARPQAPSTASTGADGRLLPPPAPPRGPPPLTARQQSAPPLSHLPTHLPPQLAHSLPLTNSYAGSYSAGGYSAGGYGASGYSAPGHESRPLHSGAHTRTAAADVAAEALQHLRHVASDLTQDVSHNLGRELSRELGREVREACRDVGSRLAAELAPDLQRLRVATDAAEARSRELGRLHLDLTARAMPGLPGGGGDASRLVQLNADLSLALQQLASARSEAAHWQQLQAAEQKQLADARSGAAHWQQLHGAEAVRARELEISNRQLRQAYEQLLAHVHALESPTAPQPLPPQPAQNQPPPSNQDQKQQLDAPPHGADGQWEALSPEKLAPRLESDP